MTDPVMTYAYSGDASPYRLIPAAGGDRQFRGRGAGGDRSGAGRTGCRSPSAQRGRRSRGRRSPRVCWRCWATAGASSQIHEDGERITLGPADHRRQCQQGAEAVQPQAGADPASQATCKIGGVVNNNSSGMCCGVAYNTYHTMQRLRVMLVDGTVLDSGRSGVGRGVPACRMRSCWTELQRAAPRGDGGCRAGRADPEKYRIKNTVGYSINAAGRFPRPDGHPDPPDRGFGGHARLCVRGDLPDDPGPSVQGDGLILFLRSAASCARAPSRRLANGGVQQTNGVTAAEYIERRALGDGRAPAGDEGLREVLHRNLAGDADRREGAGATAKLAKEIALATAILAEEGATDIDFRRWRRGRRAPALGHAQGLLPTGGATRPKGTTDADRGRGRAGGAAGRLRHRYARSSSTMYGYCGRRICSGMRWRGTCISRWRPTSWQPRGSVERFDKFSKELGEPGVGPQYGGSLKAEHGTGRAIAPFVEAEWGTTAYTGDAPDQGAVRPRGAARTRACCSNADPDRSMSNDLKRMPLADEIVDLCIECGFCEPACPSHHMTLSPRQRIAVTREKARLKASGEDPERLEGDGRGCSSMPGSRPARPAMCARCAARWGSRPARW